MNVLKTVLNVIIMLLATTFQAGTNAIATLDTERMGFSLAQVVLITDALYSDVEMSQQQWRLSPQLSYLEWKLPLSCSNQLSEYPFISQDTLVHSQCMFYTESPEFMEKFSST